MSISADRVIAVRTTKTVYRDGETVLKVFLENTPAAYVMREAMNQAAAEEAGLAVPHLCEVIRIDGKWAIRSRYIRGKTLRQRMEAEPAEAERYLSLLARIHAGIHRVSAQPLFSLREKWIRRIRTAPLPDTVREELLSRAAELPEADTLCHGELSPSNILLSSEDGQPYILDWAHAARGAAAADAAMTYILLSLHDPSGLQPQAYLRAFCSRHGASIGQVSALLPFAAASVISRYRDGDRELLCRFLHSELTIQDNP
ncbi:MAG: phosphotransferase family protein [Eubacteriales bacterium]